MQKKLLTLLVFVFSVFATANAQLSDNFSDGDFTNNPAWSGGTSDFIVNPAFELQSNNTTPSSTFYLSTPNALATAAQWEMDIRLAFSTSSANYVDVYLAASAADLSNTATSGYFVRIGNSTDEISLYLKDASGVSSKIIDGADGSLSSSTNLKLKVIRNASNNWSLYRDLTGTGTAFVLEGSVTDATFTTSSFFGLLIKQSTNSFFQKHFFDNIVIQNYVPDVTPPSIQSVTAVSLFSADVLFNEPVEQVSAETAANYSVNNGVGNPNSAQRDGLNPALVHLFFSNPVPNGAVNTLTATNISDLSGNIMLSGSSTFTFYIAQRFDLVIDEIMADPNPVVQLPDAEYLEIKNVTGKTINLQGFRISSSSSSSSAFPSYDLPADSFLIVTTTADAALFAGYGRVLGIASFPGLGNSGTTVSLISKEGVALHTVSYDPTWYQNSVKSNGGWSLEMIDTKNPCTGAANWRASTDAKGGTPGAKNAIDALNPDKTPPILVRVAATDNFTVLVTFSESIDSAKGASVSNYSISNGINSPVVATVLSPDFTKVELKLASSLAANTVYTITANNISDCSGNTITANTGKFGLPGLIDSLDIVINEVLFNPTTTGTDYVEIYNRSSKILDLKKLFIANRSSITDSLTSITNLTSDNVLVFPGDYYVISTSGALVKQNYVAKNPDNFIDISMPSYPDDKGVVVLLNSSGLIIDELRYDAKWHFGLLDNVEGVSLERVDYNKQTQNSLNWHSAASTVGYGTPSYQNSQFRSDLTVSGEVSVSPKVFSPDNDGTDDYTTINYQLADLGYVATITIFDAAGRPVRVLAQNATLAQKGSFRWDGLTDKKIKVQVGSYVILTEIFNLEGKRKSFKNVVVVGSKF